MTEFMEGLALSFKLSSILFLALFILSGCGLKIGEDPIPEGEVELKGYSCVNQISEKVKAYFNSELSEEEIKVFVGCLKSSVGDFTKRVGRKDTDVFSPEDMRAFINRIATGRKLNEKLLGEFMKIKQTFVGGRVDQISRADLASAMKLLDDIKRAALILRPHVKIFNSSLGDQVTADKIAIELDQASAALSEVSHIFVASLKNSENSYSLKDFEVFLDEFRKFIGWNEVFPDGREAVDWVELVASVKEISTGGDRYSIRKMEWETFLSFGRSVYIAYLKFKYGVNGQNIWTTVGLKNLIHVVDQVRDSVVELISARRDRVIPMSEISSLMNSLERLKWLPFGLDAATSAFAIQMISTKILERGDSDQFSGLRVFHILRLAYEFENWASTQNYISKKFMGEARSQGGPSIFMSGQGSDRSEEIFSLNLGTPLGWEDYSGFLSGRRPLFMPDERRVALLYSEDLKENGVEFDLHNLSMTHIYYRLIRAVFESYGKLNGKGKLVLSASSLQEFYTDFFPLGQSLGWLDPRSKNAGARSYVEGNLFTYSADGLNEEYDMSLSEGVDVIAYLLTAGELTQSLYDGLKERCDMGEVDFRGEKKINRVCVQDWISTLLIQNLDFAPSLKNWLISLGAEDRARYSELLLNSSFSKKNSSIDWVEKSELSTLAVVILYSESVMTKFDSNRDGILVDEEASKAFPIFRKFIADLAKGMSDNKTVIEWISTDSFVKSVFEYILYFKRAPKTTWDYTQIIWNMGEIQADLTENPGWEISSNRLALTESFSVIISQLLNTDPVVPPKKVAPTTARKLRRSRGSVDRPSESGAPSIENSAKSWSSTRSERRRNKKSPEATVSERPDKNPTKFRTRDARGRLLKAM